MKRKLAVLLLTAALLVTILATPAAAKDLRRVVGGVFNETQYSEVIFVTGEPVVVTGEAQVSEREGRGTFPGSAQFSCDLKNLDAGVTVSRRLSFQVSKEDKGKQVITVLTATSCSGRIKAGDDVYNLIDYQFNGSEITDTNPGVDFFTGNWDSRATYTRNGDLGQVVVYSQGDTIGYENPWGSTETVQISGSVSFDGEVPVGEEQVRDDWSGTFNTSAVYNNIKDITYVENQPQYISFPGGCVLVERNENSVDYQSKLPRLDADGISRGGWDNRSGSLEMKSLPTYTRLPVYSLRDITGYWAENDINILYSLGILSGGDYFAPGVLMTRAEFCRALAGALDLDSRGEEDAASAGPVINLPWLNIGQAEEESEEPFFYDVPEGHPYYDEIKAVYDEGLIMGSGRGNFSPDEPITRAQAITALIRALGFDYLDPWSSYAAPFRDDAQIPDWARESMYVGAEIGFVDPDNFGCVYPNQSLTRAEGAVLINSFIGYLREGLREEYRDRILSF